jgi:hypothetical protein
MYTKKIEIFQKRGFFKKQTQVRGKMCHGYAGWNPQPMETPTLEREI